ncbi:MAG: site-specific DNA-methyltransferase [Candidatus Shapirobacteria bacterium]|jgi:site-specific DNA-methyltransferase (adenine-specific)
MLIKKGDLIALGDHLLLCGDATDKSSVEKLLADKKIKLILTDVPYGVAYVESKNCFAKSKKDRKIIANDQVQSEQSYKQFTQQWLEIVKPFLSPKNTYYIFNSDRMLFALKNALDDSNFKFCQLLIWVKNHAVIGRMDYLPQHELIVYGWYGTHQFFKSKDKSVLAFPKPNKSPLHPTMKPISLLRHLILNSSQIGDYVYDCFGGSGSTLIACEQTKRKCLMVEIDPEYCQVIIDRFKKLKKI